MNLRRVLPLGVALFALPLFGQTAHFESMMDEMNAKLSGTNMRVAYVEYLRADAPDEEGNTVYAKNVGNKQLAGDWVPGDNYLGLNAPYGAITYLVDQSHSGYFTLTPGGPAALAAADVEAAIDRSMDTWAYTTTCSSLPIIKTPDNGADPTIIDYYLGFGPMGTTQAHLTHGGFTPPGFYPAGVLAVTYTLVWVDADGNPTDMDGNGKSDVALREIFYSGNYYWSVDPANAGYDVETISLHESGHGLSQGHFGKIFVSGNGKLHFSPLAVMNASYSQIQHSLAPTDLAGHCSIWGSWPNN